MKRFRFWIASYSAIAIAGAAWAGADKAEPQLRLELDLVDGSHIIGTPAIEAVPLQTPYAKMAIPLAQIAALRMGEDHETASVDLRDGDKLKGVINIRPVKLETVFGKVAIGIEHIKVVNVILSGMELPEALRQGLVLHYSFDRDEGEKVIDSAGSNNGYITGEVTLTTGTKGLAKTAYSFDGRASYLTVPSGGTMPDNPTCITQALWVKAPHGTPSGGQYAQTILLTKRQANDGSDWPTISMDQKHVYFGVDDYAYCEVAQSPKPINDSSWHHVVGVKNGTTYSLYVDGRLAAKPLVDAHPTDGSKAYYTIVNRVWSHFSWFAGSIDNVRVYNRALSAGEIAALYDNEKPAR